jgi:hypothetical protein
MWEERARRFDGCWEIEKDMEKETKESTLQESDLQNRNPAGRVPGESNVMGTGTLEAGVPRESVLDNEASDDNFLQGSVLRGRGGTDKGCPEMQSQQEDTPSPLELEHDSAQAVHIAAQNGCYICNWVISRVPDLRGLTLYYVDFDLFHRPSQETEDNKETAMTVEGGFLRIVTHIPGVDAAEGGTVASATFSIKVHPTFHEAEQLSCRSLQDVTIGSPHGLTLARHWLHVCQHQHMECTRKDQPSWYPSRLLRVDLSMVYLTIPSLDPPEGPYATLSYCWGKAPIDVLTPGNFENFQRGRPVESFPPTFRDCFITINKLGLRSVWIDSFCIVQGASAEIEKDWKLEASRMEEVFSNSYLNIGASHGHDSSEGCFKERKSPQESSLTWRPFGERSVTIALKRGHSSDESDLKIGKAKDDEGENYSQMQSEFDSHHLFTRGWVIQERLLAPRMLHFGKEQLWWQCPKDRLLSESSPCGLCLPQERFGAEHLWQPLLQPGGLQVPQHELHDLWLRILVDYTQCGLTKPEEDKLRAVEGVARRIATLTDDIYYMGFFMKQLPWALCWELEGDEGRMASRGRPHRAPSWSWASMDGGLIS